MVFSFGLDVLMMLEMLLMFIDKVVIWWLVELLGGVVLVDFIVEYIYICYLGECGVLYDWGYGCGDCLVCELWVRGFWVYCV